MFELKSVFSFRNYEHTMPEQFETVGNLTVKSSLQDFDAREMYLRPKDRSVSFQQRRKNLVRTAV